MPLGVLVPKDKTQLRVLLSFNEIGIVARTTHLSPRTEVGSCSNELVSHFVIKNLTVDHKTIMVQRRIESL